jgi:hypothetical protein
MLRKACLLIHATISLALAAPCPSASFYVSQSVPASGDGTSWETAFKTIAEGIESAGNGDEVIVAEGTYVETVDFSGKNITVRSSDPENPSVVSSTVIEVFGSYEVVRFWSGEAREATLAGFTISAGQTGVSCAESSPVIRRNVIVANTADFDKGGGISCYYASPLIEDNTIAANRASQGGGGIACEGGRPVIRRNLLIRNVSDADGGGILLVNSTAHINHNRIIANSAAGDGGGVLCLNSHVELLNNLIASNRAGAGGGAFVGDSSTVTLTGNTVVANSAPSGAGGVHLSLSFGTLRNCILWANSDDLAGATATYSCIENPDDSGEGNIHHDPRFTDPDGPDNLLGTQDDDYTLAQDSPCRDSGLTPAAMPLQIAQTPTHFLLSWDPGTDLAARARISGSAVDIGAYEYQELPPVYLLELSQDMILWSPAYLGKDTSASVSDSPDDRRSFFRASVQTPVPGAPAGSRTLGRLVPMPSHNQITF